MISPYQFISIKKDGLSHEPGQIDTFIQNYLNNDIEDSQLAAWLMAVCFKGMNKNELSEYVNTIINSGKQLDFSYLDGFIVDKHSTGGVGDKVSLIVAPILAACNCYVPMIVGRSLAHTGGTLDKLESIIGYQGDIDIKQFQKNVKDNRFSIIGQNKDICPADKYIYSIRDVTSTIKSLPLICASIISKKKAEGIKGLVLDIKVGNGAFMKTLKEAQELGKALINLGNSLSIESKYIITDMNQPLGRNSGLWCEVKESIDFLKNLKRDSNLNEIIYKVCTTALKMSKQSNQANLIEEAIVSGKAYEFFEKMIISHKGNLKDSYLSNNPKYEYVLKSTKEGYLNKIDTEKLGYMLVEIGGGRKKTTDKIDPSCGFTIYKKINQKIERNEPIMKIFGSNQSKIESVEKMFDDVIFINKIPNKNTQETIYQ